MSFLDSIKHALKGDNHESIGTRFGLLFDPLHYASKLFGKQDQYDAFVNKSGDFLNKQASSVVKPVDKFARKYDPLHKAITNTPEGEKAAEWISNKPASTAGLIYGGVAGAGALGGLGGGGSANLGVFSNGGVNGLAGVGGGNAGALAASGGISGGAGTAGGAAGGAGSQALGWQDWAKIAGKMMPQGQSNPGMQYQPRSAELERQRRLQEEAERQKALTVAALRNDQMYSPA